MVILVFTLNLVVYRQERRAGGTHLNFLFGNSTGFSKTDYQWGCESPTAKATFLTAARDERVDSDFWFAADITGADTLWAVDFVARDAH